MLQDVKHALTERAIIICDANNIASIKVMESNGAVYLDTHFVESEDGAIN